MGYQLTHAAQDYLNNVRTLSQVLLLFSHRGQHICLMILNFHFMLYFNCPCLLDWLDHLASRIWLTAAHFIGAQVDVVQYIYGKKPLKKEDLFPMLLSAVTHLDCPPVPLKYSCVWYEASKWFPKILLYIAICWWLIRPHTVDCCLTAFFIFMSIYTLTGELLLIYSEIKCAEAMNTDRIIKK